MTVPALDYQRILGVLDERQPAGQGSLKAREFTVQLGLEATSAKVEGVRSKARRPAERGWLLQETSGAFSVGRRPVAVPDAGPPRDHRPPDQRLAAGRQRLVVPGQSAPIHRDEQHPALEGQAPRPAPAYFVGALTAQCGHRLAKAARAQPGERGYPGRLRRRDHNSHAVITHRGKDRQARCPSSC